MNHDANKLLDDVLAEGAAADFRDATLGGTLRHVRRRRTFRQARRVGGLLVALALGGVLLWQQNPPKKMAAPAPVARAVRKNYQAVETQPLPPGAVVATRAMAPAQFITSTAFAGMVATRADHYRLLNDDELLALAGQRPAILVRTGPHSEELVFADPEDEKGVPPN